MTAVPPPAATPAPPAPDPGSGTGPQREATGATQAPPAAPGQGKEGKKALGARRARAMGNNLAFVCAVLLAFHAVLAGTGAAARLLAVPGPGEAVAAWLAATAILAAVTYRRISPRARQEPGEGITWEPGQPPPAGIPAATITAAGRILTATRSRRWRGAWLEVAPCTDPARHGMCHGASATPGGDRMIRVVLGEHLAGRPAESAFVTAHETRHPAGPMLHLSVLATSARTTAWLIAGWAVPWPWLLPALAAIQAAYAAACWATEAGCDIGATRSEGRDAARAAFEYYRAIDREPRPARRRWRRRLTLLLAAVSVPTAHPPLRLRAAITSLVPAPRHPQRAANPRQARR